MLCAAQQELPWDQASDVPHSDDIVLDSENTGSTASEKGENARCDVSTVGRTVTWQNWKLSSFCTCEIT